MRKMVLIIVLLLCSVTLSGTADKALAQSGVVPFPIYLEVRNFGEMLVFQTEKLEKLEADLLFLEKIARLLFPGKDFRPYSDIKFFSALVKRAIGENPEKIIVAFDQNGRLNGFLKANNKSAQGLVKLAGELSLSSDSYQLSTNQHVSSFKFHIGAKNFQIDVSNSAIFFNEVNEAGQELKYIEALKTLEKKSMSKDFFYFEANLPEVFMGIFRTVEDRFPECISNQNLLDASIKQAEASVDFSQKELNQKQLINLGILQKELNCPNGGKYLINKGLNVSSYCSVHGSINKPRFSVQTYEDLPFDTKPFKKLYIKFREGKLLVKMDISDQNLVNQWAAIFKHQILAKKTSFENRVRGLSKSEFEKVSSFFSRIDCKPASGALEIWLDDIDESFLKLCCSSYVSYWVKNAYYRRINYIREYKASKCYEKQTSLLTKLEKEGYFDSLRNGESSGFEVLVQNQIFDEIPKCTEDGELTVFRNNRGDLDVRCSKHIKQQLIPDSLLPPE